MSSSSEAEVKWGWLPHSPLPPHPLIIWASPTTPLWHPATFPWPSLVSLCSALCPRHVFIPGQSVTTCWNVDLPSLPLPGNPAPPPCHYAIYCYVFFPSCPQMHHGGICSRLQSVAEACEGSGALFQPRLLIYSGGRRQNAASTRTLRAEWRYRLLAVRAKATSRWPDDGTERVRKRLSWSAWVLK